MMCTYEGYCRVCPNGTGGPYCFEGCIDWCGDYQDLTNTTTTALISRVTKNPYHTHSGFDLENFWYYLMVILLLVVVVCLSGLDISKGEKKDKAIQEITEQRRESSETAVDITAKPEHLTRSNTSIASMSETPIQ
ncbi:hypothetical protein BgiMline_036094 [Biomphalaria glabrata]|nr:hypothetical protein BgiMline_034816 [Biomphalaria glabrata]